MAVAETSRKQNSPELITAQEHHHTLLRPWSVALGTQQQRPEAACRHDALEQTPGLRGRTLLARGIGAGHQHQMQRSWRALRPGTQAKAGVQPFGQRSNPGGQFTGTVRNENNGRSWFCWAGTGQRKKMRMARLELARPKPHAPQTCVSTNSTTSAWSTSPLGCCRGQIIPGGVFAPRQLRSALIRSGVRPEHAAGCPSAKC